MALLSSGPFSEVGGPTRVNRQFSVGRNIKRAIREPMTPEASDAGAAGAEVLDHSERGR
jgi:hypothetical protein